MKNTISTLFLAILLIGCSEEPKIDIDPYVQSEVGSMAVATIGSEKITRAELDYNLAFYSSNPMTSSEEGRIKVLNELVEDQVLFNKAKEMGFDKSPEFLLNQRKLLAFEYRKYIKKKVGENVKVTDFDVERYYEQNIEKFTKPAMYRIALYLKRDDVEKKKTYTLKQIADAARYLKPEEGFGQYAVESDDLKNSRAGGKLPWMTKGSNIAGVPSEIINKGGELDLGEVAGPIKLDKGQYLVRLVAKRDKQITPLDQVKPQIREQLLQQQKEALLKVYIAQAKDSYEIKLLEENMGSPDQVPGDTNSFGPPGFPVQ